LTGKPNGCTTLKLARAALVRRAHDAVAEAMMLEDASCANLRRNL
jgi:hypothetical protein